MTQNIRFIKFGYGNNIMPIYFGRVVYKNIKCLDSKEVHILILKREV